MFNTLIAAQESLTSVMTADIDLLVEQAEQALDSAYASDALLKDVANLKTFSTLLTQSSDPSALIQLADTDGGLSALMGVNSTSDLLVLSVEELSDTANATASAAETAETGDEADAKASNKKKWKKAALATAAALSAIAAGYAGYKIYKGRTPAGMQDKLLKTINSLTSSEYGRLKELPENPTAEIEKRIRAIAGDMGGLRDFTNMGLDAVAPNRNEMRSTRMLSKIVTKAPNMAFKHYLKSAKQGLELTKKIAAAQKKSAQ